MSLTNIIASLGLSICDVMLIRYYLNYTFEEKMKHRTLNLITALTFFFVINAMNISMTSYYALFTIGVFIIFHSYNISTKKQIMLIVILIISKFLLENVLVLFFSWVFNISTSLYRKTILFSYVILIKVLIRYIYYIAIINYQIHSTAIVLHHFKWISLFVSFYFSITIILLDKTLFYFPGIGRTFVFVVIVYNFALIMFDRYQRKAESIEKEFLITKQRIEDDKRYIIKTQEAHQEMRAFRHDLINKLTIITANIKSNQSDVALKHLEEMGVTIVSNRSRVYIGDPSVDSIIDARVDEMDNSGISFKESYGLICLGNIDSYDLALIFALALDNAIEAVHQIINGHKQISINIYTQREYLYIVIENTIVPKSKVNFLRTSKKSNIESHGFGVKKIKSLVNKYDGLLDYSVSNDTVSLKIVLNNNLIEEKA